MGKAFLALRVKNSVHPCSQNSWKISNNLRQISCFFELVDDGNTTTTPPFSNVVLMSDALFYFKFSQLFLDSFSTLLFASVRLCSDLESRRTTTVDGPTNLG